MRASMAPAAPGAAARSSSPSGPSPRAYMKALSLKVKAAGGGGGGGGESHARAPRRRRRRRRRGRSPEADEPPDKDAASSVSASARIAPHEGEEHERCDKCCSPSRGAGTGEEGEEAAAAAAGASDGEWVAEPEPGVLMTLVPRADGTNHLRRIRFSKELFADAWEAQTWWADNYDRVVELYSIVQSEHGDDDEHDDGDDDDQAPVTPCQSEDDEHQRQDRIGSLEYSASCSASASGGSTSNFSGPSSGSGSGGGSANTVDSPILGLVIESNSSTKAKAAQALHSQTTGLLTLTEEIDTCSSTCEKELNG
ncbi:hypothetical protein ACP4OV_011395 [Aristida adscensionis]